MKVGFVPTWCISGFGLSRGGFGLAEVRCVYNSVHCQSFCLLLVILLTIYSQLHWFIEAVPLFVPSVVYRAHFLMVRSCYSTIWRFFLQSLCFRPATIGFVRFIDTAFPDPDSSFLSATL
jgi:hypothetical protein